MALLTFKPLFIDPETKMHTLDNNSPVKLTSQDSGAQFYFHELNTNVDERFYITTILSEGEESIIVHECGKKKSSNTDKSVDILYIHISSGKSEINCHIYDAKKNPNHEKDLLGLVDKWIVTIRLAQDVADDICEAAVFNCFIGVITENKINNHTIAHYIDNANKEPSKNVPPDNFKSKKHRRSQITPEKRIKIFRQILERKIEIDDKVYEIIERKIEDGEHHIIFNGPLIQPEN